MGAGIEFKPGKSHVIDSNFGSKTNIAVNVKPAGKQVDADVQSYNNIAGQIDSSFNTVASAFGTENSFKGQSGIEEKFQYLKYALEHETGNYLVIKNNNDKHILYLYNKLGSEISHVDIPNELPGHQNLVNKYLYIDTSGNLVWRTCGPSGIEYFSGLGINIDGYNKINIIYDDNWFSITDTGKLALNIDKLDKRYATKASVDKKQDQLDTQPAYTDVGSKSRIPQITTNELGQVTKIVEIPIEIPEAGVQEITAGEGLTGGTIKTKGTIAVNTEVVALKDDLKITAQDKKIDW